MPTIRTLVIIALFGSVFILMMMLSIGGFAASNSVGLPSNVTRQYQALDGNSTSNSVVGGISPLQQKVQSQFNLSKNQSFVSGTVGSVSLTVSMFDAMNVIWGSYIGFIGQGLQVIGINPSFAEGIGIIIIVSLLALSIASAILLFPL